MSRRYRNYVGIVHRIAWTTVFNNALLDIPTYVHILVLIVLCTLCIVLFPAYLSCLSRLPLRHRLCTIKCSHINTFCIYML